MYNKLNLMDTDIALKTMDVDLTIPEENTQDAFQALCNLNAYDDLKSGCIFSSRKLIKPENSTSLAEDPSVRFINMPWNYDEVCETVEEVLELLNFSVEKDLEGDIHILAFESDRGGDEEVFVEALAPYVKSGYFIEWQADNGEMWRNDFVQKKMITSTGEVSWTVNAA